MLRYNTKILVLWSRDEHFVHKWLLIHLQAAVGVRTLRNQGAKNIAIDVMTNEHGILISFNFFLFFFRYIY